MAKAAGFLSTWLSLKEVTARGLWWLSLTRCVQLARRDTLRRRQWRRLNVTLKLGDGKTKRNADGCWWGEVKKEWPRNKIVSELRITKRGGAGAGSESAWRQRRERARTRIKVPGGLL